GDASAQVVEVVCVEGCRVGAVCLIQRGTCVGPVVVLDARECFIDGGFECTTSENEKQCQDERHQHQCMMKAIMTASFINGTKIAEDIKNEVADEVQALKSRGVRPGLAVVLVGDDAASSAYVNMKARTCEQLGIYSRKLTIPSSVTTEQLLAEVRKLNEDDAIDGILAQLPLPKHVSKHAVLESVDPKKDVDGFHS